MSQADVNDEDPLFGDIANEGVALNIANEDKKRIEFKRN
jgi:tRNA 2-thiocytidine biosynthesis protein TtcA